jgi:hypothetical protein
MATDDHERDQRIAEAIRGLADDDGRLTSPPSNLWGRIERAIDDSPEAAGDLVPPPPEVWERIADDVRADTSQPVAAPRTSRHRRRTLGLVAAAILVVGALAAAAVLIGRSPEGSERELVAQASLSGEGLDPGGDSSGSAELLRRGDGWKVALQVDDLPSPPDGTYYEAWLLGSGADQVQSLGTLDGTDQFSVPQGLTIDDFPLVDVSIEPIDGNPAHSSKSVLRGRLEST